MSVRSTLGAQKSRALLVATAAAAVGLALSACSPNEHPAPKDATYETPAPRSGEVVDQNMIRDGQAQVAELRLQAEGSEATAEAEATAETTTGGGTASDFTGAAVGSVSFAVVPNPNDADDAAVAVTVAIPVNESLKQGLYSMHVHQGTTCAAPGGHLMSGGTDIGALPSVSILGDGSAAAMSTTQAFDPAQIAGKAVVLHDPAGSPVACGVIGDPNTRAN